MTHLEYFKNLNREISFFAEEVTTCLGRVEENLFKSDEVPNEVLSRFIAAMGETFGIGVELGRLQQFSFQQADGISYLEDKFMIVYSGGKTRAGAYGFDLAKPHDDYCINYFVQSKKTAVKYYDLELSEYQTPSLPKGSEMASPFGHGVALGTKKQDTYFCHRDLFHVADFFKLPQPSVAALAELDNDTSVQKVFGLTFCSETLEPIKLKRYFYPRDPLLKTILYDEVGNMNL